MKNQNLHTFHIPVMGIGFTIDTPLKVAPYGINSVISIVDDIVIEQMRGHYYQTLKRDYIPIGKKEPDHRARRITDYLNLIQQMTTEKFDEIRAQDFRPGADICKYFEYLPASSPVKARYESMLTETDETRKKQLQESLRAEMQCGSVDVNIMVKVDTVNYDSKGKQLPEIYNDAMAALRGYARSELTSSIVLSAGMNPRLYNYMGEFEDFLPREDGFQKKKVILKVSDFRSASVQGKFLAKKGVWISEFRIESGLNCGGHVFATDGKLLGPVLEEFNQQKEALTRELFEMCNAALAKKGHPVYPEIPPVRTGVQGGIGTAAENDFLIRHYQIDSTGWGSPFLLVPEVTSVDEETRNQLANAQKEDYYLSNASPLGVPFRNFRSTSSERLLKERIRKDRPGSPCNKKFLTFNNEFTEKNICTASRQYQHLKLKELKMTAATPEEYEEKSKKIMEKECLCEGLAAPALIVNDALKPKQLRAVTICPGPNLAYFSGLFSLREMIDHIYGRRFILNALNREHMFVNELELYVEHLSGEIQKCFGDFSQKKSRQLKKFKSTLLEGVEYYKDIFRKMKTDTEERAAKALAGMEKWEEIILKLAVPEM